MMNRIATAAVAATAVLIVAGQATAAEYRLRVASSAVSHSGNVTPAPVPGSPPVLTGGASLGVYSPSATAFGQITATDPDGDAITFGALNLPPFLVVDPATGVITARGSTRTSGIYTFTGTATSRGQVTGAPRFVEITEVAPVWASVDPIFVHSMSVGVWRAVATPALSDANGDSVEVVAFDQGSTIECRKVDSAIEVRLTAGTDGSCTMLALDPITHATYSALLSAYEVAVANWEEGSTSMEDAEFALSDFLSAPGRAISVSASPAP